MQIARERRRRGWLATKASEAGEILGLLIQIGVAGAFLLVVVLAAFGIPIGFLILAVAAAKWMWGQ